MPAGTFGRLTASAVRLADTVRVLERDNVYDVSCVSLRTTAGGVAVVSTCVIYQRRGGALARMCTRAPLLAHAYGQLPKRLMSQTCVQRHGHASRCARVILLRRSWDHTPDVSSIRVRNSSSWRVQPSPARGAHRRTRQCTTDSAWRRRHAHPPPPPTTRPQ